MSNYKKELDKMTWSFSRVSCYENCPYQFYLHYLLHENGVSNFYAENGKLVHEILESLLKGELELDVAPSVYLDRFSEIVDEVGENTMDSTMEKCCDFFCDLDLKELSKYNILGVEKEVRAKIGKYDFVGYIDLLLQNKDTNEIIIVDHKSRNYTLKKDGKTPLKASEIDFLHYKRQLYLYDFCVFQEYKKHASFLAWNHFKNKKVAKIPFTQEEYEEALTWFETTIQKIYKDKTFEAVNNYMMCNVLCQFRYGECEYKNGEEEGD